MVCFLTKCLQSAVQLRREGISQQLQRAPYFMCLLPCCGFNPPLHSTSLSPMIQQVRYRKNSRRQKQLTNTSHDSTLQNGDACPQIQELVRARNAHTKCIAEYDHACFVHVTDFTNPSSPTSPVDSLHPNYIFCGTVRKSLVVIKRHLACLPLVSRCAFFELSIKRCVLFHLPLDTEVLFESLQRGVRSHPWAGHMQILGLGRPWNNPWSGLRTLCYPSSHPLQGVFRLTHEYVAVNIRYTDIDQHACIAPPFGSFRRSLLQQ